MLGCLVTCKYFLACSARFGELAPARAISGRRSRLAACEPVAAALEVAFSSQPPPQQQPPEYAGWAVSNRLRTIFFLGS